MKLVLVFSVAALMSIVFVACAGCSKERGAAPGEPMVSEEVFTGGVVDVLKEYQWGGQVYTTLNDVLVKPGCVYAVGGLDPSGGIDCKRYPMEMYIKKLQADHGVEDVLDLHVGGKEVVGECIAGFDDGQLVALYSERVYGGVGKEIKIVEVLKNGRQKDLNIKAVGGERVICVGDGSVLFVSVVSVGSHGRESKIFSVDRSGFGDCVLLKRVKGAAAGLRCCGQGKLCVYGRRSGERGGDVGFVEMVNMEDGELEWRYEVKDSGWKN